MSRWDREGAIQWLVRNDIVTAMVAVEVLLREDFATPEALLQRVRPFAKWSEGSQEAFESLWGRASAEAEPPKGRATRAGKRRIRTGNTQPPVRTAAEAPRTERVAARATLRVREPRDTQWDNEYSPSTEWESNGVKYREQGTIGAGGMGTVRAAVDTRLNRLVALKCLHPDTENDETMVDALLTEARLTGRLEHPNIIPVYELGRLPSGEVFYSMKNVEGKQFLHLLEEEKTRASSSERGVFGLLRVFQGLCMALSFAHSKGVLHRDLKPENVLVGDHGEVYLLDWGIAKDMTEEAPSPFAGEGVVAGTPEYMSPEQARGENHQLDARSDIYSLGVLLYEILTGALPPKAAERLLGHRIEFPAAVAPEAPLAVSLSEICMRALSLEEEERFEDARELWGAIEAELEGSKERERLRHLSQRAVAHGDVLKKDLEELYDENQSLRSKIRELESSSSPWDLERNRAQLWSWRNELMRHEIMRGRLYTESYTFYQQALGYDQNCEEAREGLKGLYEAEIGRARDEQDVARLVQFLALRRGLEPDLGQEPGKVTIRSHPSGAELFLFGADELHSSPTFDGTHRLGLAPLHQLELQPGAYLLIARAEGYRETHHVLVVESGRARVESILLHGWNTEVPLVGRSEELGRIALQHQWSIQNQVVRMVLLRGQAGMRVGTILNKVVERIQDHPEDHFYMAHSASRYGELVPYSAFAEMLRSRIGVSPGDSPEQIREHVLEAIRFARKGRRTGGEMPVEEVLQCEEVAEGLAQLPGLLEAWGAVDAPWTVDDELRVFRCIEQWFLWLSERMHLVLIVRELQWVDSASLRLFLYLEERLREKSLFVLAVESPDDEGNWGSTLTFHETITLDVLRADSVGHLFREVWNLPIDDAVIEQTFAYTRGMPYAVERVVRGLLEEQLTTVENGQLRLSSEGQLRLQGEFDGRVSVERRVQKFALEVRRALQKMSLFEGRFSSDGIAALGVEHPEKVLELLRRSGFLECEEDAGAYHQSLYRFRSGIERESLRESQGEAARIDFARTVCNWLSTLAEQSPQWSAEYADNLQRSGQAHKAMDVYRRLEAYALRLRAKNVARQCATRCSELESEVGDKRGRRSRIHQETLVLPRRRVSAVTKPLRGGGQNPNGGAPQSRE